MSDLVKKAYEVVGLGKFGSNSHPVHPATIHFPLAFLALANILNVLYGVTAYLPTNLPFTADKENLGTLAILGYFSNILGMLTSIPALLTGFAELYAMIDANGLYQTNKNGEKALVPKVKTTLTHAGLNDVTILLALYNWLLTRKAEDFKPAGHQIVISGAALLTALYAAYLGGGLVYSKGVGVQRMGTGAELKRAEIEETVAKKE